MNLAGKAAPDFELLNQSGERVRLSALRGTPVVLFFYPEDDTSGCTKEACAFRDRIGDFRNARVFGISSNSADSHERFIAKYSLPFPLLSDPGGRVRKLYGVRRTFGVIPGRVTFVIDAGGVVRHVFNSQFAPARHVEEALRVLNEAVGRD